MGAEAVAVALLPAAVALLPAAAVLVVAMAVAFSRSSRKDRSARRLAWEGSFRMPALKQKKMNEPFMPRLTADSDLPCMLGS